MYRTYIVLIQTFEFFVVEARHSLRVVYKLGEPLAFLHLYRLVICNHAGCLHLCPVNIKDS